MDMLQGKHFSITDPQGVNTVIYQINKTEKDFLKEYPKYTVERLDYTEEIRGNSRRKTFYVDNPQPQGNQLAILSFAGEKVIINSGILIDDEVRIAKNPSAFKFDTLYSEEEQEFKDFIMQYKDNLNDNGVMIIGYIYTILEECDTIAIFNKKIRDEVFPKDTYSYEYFKAASHLENDYLCRIPTYEKDACLVYKKAV